MLIFRFRIWFINPKKKNILFPIILGSCFSVRDSTKYLRTHPTRHYFPRFSLKFSSQNQFVLTSAHTNPSSILQFHCLMRNYRFRSYYVGFCILENQRLISCCGWCFCGWKIMAEEGKWWLTELNIKYIKDSFERGTRCKRGKRHWWEEGLDVWKSLLMGKILLILEHFISEV